MKLPILFASLVFISNVLAVEPGEAAPDFTLKSHLGENLRLQEYRGKVVLINFWATWCGPCRQEMPILSQIHDRYAPIGFTVLGVNVEGDSDKVRRVLERSGVSFPVLFDQTQSTSESYRVEAMPYTVLVDRDGTVRYVHDGYKPGDEQQYVNQLKAVLRP